MTIFELIETIKLAGGSIKVNKLRSSLAALGVVIGISFVILTGWIISGLDNALKDTINIIGQDMLYVDKWDWAAGKNWKLSESRKDITIFQAEQLCDKITTAEVAVPIARKGGSKVKYFNESFEGTLTIGTHYQYALTPSGSIVNGRFFTQTEQSVGANVIVLGSKVAETIFPETDPIDKVITVHGRKFLVIGVVKKQGTMLMDFIDNQNYIPLTTFTSLYGGQNNRNVSVAIKAGDLKSMENIKEEVRGLMRVIRNLQPHMQDDFSINETKAFEEIVASFRAYVWGIGMGLTLLSFLVGIIGIMNIMFVSVAERTKEIGIRKAIGAKKSSIILQFIVESSTLCLIGAVVSFVFCTLVIYLAATFLPKIWSALEFLKPVMPYQFLIIGSVVSILVGILAGLIPAMKAANLDPVDALRYE